MLVGWDLPVWLSRSELVSNTCSGKIEIGLKLLRRNSRRYPIAYWAGRSDWHICQILVGYSLGPAHPVAERVRGWMIELSVPLPLERQIGYATEFFMNLVSSYGRRRYPMSVLHEPGRWKVGERTSDLLR